MSRYIIFGAGAVGGLMGGQLHLAGHDVVLIARGAHREALAHHGLRLKTTATEDVIKLVVVGAVSDIAIRAEDTVILAMKTQDSAAALKELASISPPGIAIVCAQNGVENERIALRLFEHVYGAFVFVYSALMEAGVVTCYTFPCLGIVDIGRYPQGSDERADIIATDLRAAGFKSVACPDIMRWKRGKLLINSGSNVINAVSPATDIPDDVSQEAREEAERCFRAAKLDFTSPDDIDKHGRDYLSPKTVDGRPFPGGSTFQSLARGTPASEVDYINGEIILLGRTVGIPTPINLALQRLMQEMIKSGAPPGSISAAELRQRVKADEN